MSHRLLVAATVSLGATFLSGCAPSFGAGRIDGGQDALSPEERRLQVVESKLSEVSRRLDGINYAGLDKDNLKLRDDIRALRGEIERLHFDFDGQTKRNKDQYLDMDRRLQKVESSSAAVPAAPPVSAAPPPQNSPVSLAPATSISTAAPVVISNGNGGTPEEESAYLATFELLKNGKYDDAIRGFHKIIEKWPQGHYADNATYWTGEAYYVKRDYKSALTNFQAVLDKYPGSSKSPEAMLKVGLTQVELKQLDKGRATLQKVIETYPNANAANLARQKLESIKSAN
jgi:tol-pal system protein YbgF